MAHGLNTSVKRGTSTLVCKNEGKAGIGSRRIFAPQFKLQVLDSYRNDVDCKGNQRATARKYGIHRRQIQKWLQVENNLRNSVIKSKSGELSASPEARKCGIELALRSCEHRQRDDVSSEAYSQQRQVETEAELERKTLQRIGGSEARDTMVDKRVPDIPQHSPSYSEHHWLNNRTETDREVEICHQREHKPERSPVSSPHSHIFLPLPVPVVAVPVPVSVPVPVTSSLSLSALAPVPHPLPQQSHSSARASVPIPVPGPVPVVSPASAPVFKCECPEASPLPLDFTTHSRRAGSLPDSTRGASPVRAFADNAAPMDLSLKKPYMPYPRIEPELHTPVFVCSSTPLSHHGRVIHSDHPLPDSQIWDLSTKGIKRPHDSDDDVTTGYSYSSNVSSSTADVKPAVQDIKPVKLFKPYLLDHTDDSSDNSVDNKPLKCVESCGLDLGYNSRLVLSDSESYFYNNNNNTEYSFYKDETYPVNIRATGNLYCPINTDYYTANNIHLNYVDDVKNSFILKKNSNLIKQRQSYSLDFKLSAIQCYYSDEVCKGNQRAVATKYKIHRRQVQKWLKQEDQLRQRNETSKHMHIVR